MIVAVTGATGFIGTHVTRALLARGETVIAVVRRMPTELVTGVRYVVFDLIEADTGSYEAIGTPEQLVHLAWGGLPNYLSRHHFETELPLQYRFLQTMVEAGLPSILVTGTCYEYGMFNGELVETFDARPANPYAFAKVALMRQLQFLQKDRDFALTWARLFYTWGEAQAPTSIYPLLKAAIARGDSGFPMSAGEQLRDYLTIDDLAGIIAALATRRSNDGVVNVSSGDPVSIRALVERWIDESGAKIVPELGRYPYPSYEPLAFWGSTAKRRRLLDQLS